MARAHSLGSHEARKAAPARAMAAQCRPDRALARLDSSARNCAQTLVPRREQRLCTRCAQYGCGEACSLGSHEARLSSRHGRLMPPWPRLGEARQQPCLRRRTSHRASLPARRNSTSFGDVRPWFGSGLIAIIVLVFFGNLCSETCAGSGNSKKAWSFLRHTLHKFACTSLEA